MAELKKGDPITILLYGHDDDCDGDCACGGRAKVSGHVERVGKDGFITATIDDINHPLSTVSYEIDGQTHARPRVITCSPDQYEVRT